MTIPKPAPPRRPPHLVGFAEFCPACRADHGPPRVGQPYSLDVAVRHQREVLEQYHRLAAVMGAQ